MNERPRQGLGWDSTVDMKFQAGPGRGGWRVVAPATMPPELAEVAGLVYDRGWDRYQSELFAVPPSGLKRKMREHCERQMYRAQRRVREAETGLERRLI